MDGFNELARERERAPVPGRVAPRWRSQRRVSYRRLSGNPASSPHPFGGSPSKRETSHDFGLGAGRPMHCIRPQEAAQTGLDGLGRQTRWPGSNSKFLLDRDCATGYAISYGKSIPIPHELTGISTHSPRSVSRQGYVPRRETHQTPAP